MSGIKNPKAVKIMSIKVLIREKKSMDIPQKWRIVSRKLILNLIINKVIKKGSLTLEMMILNNVVPSMMEDSMVAKTKRMAEEGFINNLLNLNKVPPKRGKQFSQKKSVMIIKYLTDLNR